MTTNNATYAALDQWIDQHFDEQVQFFQKLVQVPTDTPPGDNTPTPSAPPSCCRPWATKPKSMWCPKPMSKPMA